MATKTIKVTHSLDLLTSLLAGVEMIEEKKTNTTELAYTLRGCEVIVQFKGNFYKVTVEALDAAS